MKIKKLTAEEYNVIQINSIKTKYSKLRSASKAPTFALTYQGTNYTLQKNCGFSKEEAETIEKNYHELYKVSDAWLKDKVVSAYQNGYVELAFGLKLRCPVLNQTVLGNSKTLHAAEQAVRTLGNAVSGQSYGLLNTRALVEFMYRVWGSKWKYSIYPTALIHDAIYLVIEDNLECLKWTNDNLIECMQWQELKEIQHDKIKLNAELEVFYEGWNNPIVLGNFLSRNDLEKTITEQLNELRTDV